MKEYVIEVRSCDGTNKLIRTHKCTGIRSAKDTFKQCLQNAMRFNMYVRTCDEHGNDVSIRGIS